MSGIENHSSDDYKNETSESHERRDGTQKSDHPESNPWEIKQKEWEKTQDRLPSNGSREMIADQEAAAQRIVRENMVREETTRNAERKALEAEFAEAFPDFQRDRTAPSESPLNTARQPELGRCEGEGGIV